MWKMFVIVVCLVAFAETLCAQESFRPTNVSGHHVVIRPNETNGPFGQRALDGPMDRSNQASRFSDNGIVYDSRGRFISVNPNSGSSRFTQAWKDPNYQYFSSDDYYIDLEMSSRAVANSLYKYRYAPNGPTPSLPIPPKPTPIPRPKNELAAQTLRNEKKEKESTQQQPVVIQRDEIAKSQQQKQGSQWFRTPASGSTVAPTRSGLGINNSGTRSVGTSQIPRPGFDGIPARQVYIPPPTPQQIAAAEKKTLEKFQIGLEEMLLRSPEVHLLSPVEVKFSGGVATVRGLVADETHKVKAEEILLTAPGVNKVQNLLSSLSEPEESFD